MVFYPRIAVIKNYFEYDNNKQRKKKATLTYKLDSIQKIKKTSMLIFLVPPTPTPVILTPS